MAIIGWLSARPLLRSNDAGAVVTHPQTALNLRTLSELLRCTPSHVEKLDIGLMNALCAEGLHGSENLVIGDVVEKLDGMARYVKQETDRHSYKFRDHPERFRNSLGYFQMMMLGTVLANDLRIRYNPELALLQRDGRFQQWVSPRTRETLYPWAPGGAASRNVRVDARAGCRHWPAARLPS